MKQVLENLTKKPLWITLNSGQSINVSTTMHSREIDQNELLDNKRIEMLEQQGLIRIHNIGTGKTAAKKTTDTKPAEADTGKTEENKAKPTSASPKK